MLWRHTHDATKDLREMAWACVTYFETDIDEAARSFADQLLGAGDSLPGDEP